MKYVIAAPLYTHASAGVRVLYELQKHLIRLGQDAITTNAPCHMMDEDVLILPEIFGRNLFPGKRVVRYYLNVPIDGVEYGEDEITLTYNKHDYPNADVHLRIPVIEPFFRDMGLKREYVAAYVGKGKEPEFYPDKAVILTRGWPAKRQEVAELLNRCSVLYTYDDKTMLSEEALACGCKVIVVKDNSEVEFTGADDAPPYIEALKRLVEMTQ